MTSAKIRYANLICPYIKTPNEKSCKIDSRTMLSWVKLERDLASRFSNLVSVYLLLFSQYHKAIHLLSQSHLLRSSKPLTVKIVNVSWCSPIFSFKGKITNNARASRFCLKRSTFIFAQFEDNAQFLSNMTGILEQRPKETSKHWFLLSLSFFLGIIFSL